MATLQESANSILQEKNEKVLPENIKKGVSIFGIEGILEMGDIKKFESKELMDADTQKAEGDLAVIYREEFCNTTADAQFQLVKFPKTVVLEEAFTEYASIMLRPVENTVMFDCWGDLGPTDLYLSIYTEREMFDIRYQSEDGITYVRRDSGEEIIDLGCLVHYYNNSFNSVVGNFIQYKAMTFDGMYQCKAVVVDTHIKALTGASDASNLNYDIVPVNMHNLALAVNEAALSTSGYQIYKYNPTTKKGSVLKTGMVIAFIEYNGAKYLSFGDGNIRTYSTADIDYETLTISNIQDYSNYDNALNVGSLRYGGYNGYAIIPYNDDDLIFALYGYDSYAKPQSAVYSSNATGTMVTQSITCCEAYDIEGLIYNKIS